jgi:hypothetical protein
MNPFVFWAALITVLFFAVGLSSKAPHNIAEFAGASLAWVAAFGLVWHRWVRKPGLWLARLAAAIGVVLLMKATMPPGPTTRGCWRLWKRMYLRIQNR